jgi:hypothetical protein
VRHVIQILQLFFLSLFVSSCGSGAGGSGGSGAAVSFSPTTVSANIASGTSATLTVRATASDPSLFSKNLYVAVVDSARVLLPSIELSAVDTRTISATLHTSPTLAQGHYQGSFQVHFCADSQCANEYAGSPVDLPYDITVTPAPLQATPATSTAATVHHGAATTGSVNVAVSGPSLAWTATTSATWLQINGGSGTGAGNFTVDYLTSALGEGNYSDSVTVRSSDGQTVVLPFSLAVLPTNFVITSGNPIFNAINGAPIAPQTLGFALDNSVPASWSATNSAAWLLATPLSGTTPAVMTLQPDPTKGPLSSGSYTASLVLSASGIPSKTVSPQLTLTKATLSAPALGVTLGGAKGRDLTTPQSLAVSLNTGATAWPFTLSGLPAWLSSTTTTGTVSQSGTTLSFVPQAASVTPGSTSATVSMSSNINGDTVTLPVTVNMNADQHRLLPSEWGVAMASSPTGTTLTHTVSISDNFGGTQNWSASSNAAWLAVTSTDDTGASPNLLLTANPTTLPNETVSYANVTVSAATSGVESAVIRVALWKSATGLAAITTLTQQYTNVIADTIRPYVYVNNGGTAIDVFNAYTAQKIATVVNAGAALGQMSVSPDGQRLYALDTAAKSMAVVDLTTLTKTTGWALDSAVNQYSSVLAFRPNGVDVVLVGDGTAYIGGYSLGGGHASGDKLVTPADGKYVFGGDGSVRFGADYSAMSGGVLFTPFLNSIDIHSRGNPQDFAINKSGTRAYSASGGGTMDVGYKCAAIDATTGTFIGALPGGEAYPNNVEVTADGRAICGISGWYSTYDIFVHASNGAFLKGYKFAGYAKALIAGQMVVTPDGFVVVGLTDDPVIAFVPIGGP